MDIKSRILARPDLAAARATRDIDALAAGLNEECVATLVPVRVTMPSLMYEHPTVVQDFIQRAADGYPVQERAQAMLSAEGIEIMVDGFEPPMVDRWMVNDAMFNPDGSEK